ncbi:MAG: hypothetical protein LBC89_03000 [Bacteroidales bacterium]|nr:hypothetical protein [Bacteroidales bacterium]
MLIISLIFFATANLFAQDSIRATFDLNYTTEIQSNFGKKYNWINLLSLSGEPPLRFSTNLLKQTKS